MTDDVKAYAEKHYPDLFPRPGAPMTLYGEVVVFTGIRECASPELVKTIVGGIMRQNPRNVWVGGSCGADNHVLEGIVSAYEEPDAAPHRHCSIVVPFGIMEQPEESRKAIFHAKQNYATHVSVVELRLDRIGMHPSGHQTWLFRNVAMLQLAAQYAEIMNQTCRDAVNMHLVSFSDGRRGGGTFMSTAYASRVLGLGDRIHRVKVRSQPKAGSPKAKAARNSSQPSEKKT